MQKRNKYHDTGILLLRLGFGIFFMMYGMPKLMKGSEAWESLGKQMSYFGITFWPVFWGFLAAFSEFAGGILLILGLFTRTAAFFMLITMIVAVASHLKDPDFIKSGAHAAEDGIVFLSLVFIGAGKYSLDSMLGRK